MSQGMALVLQSRGLAIEHKDPLCLSADVFAGWLRATCLMDNRGPLQKYVRLDWTNIRWLYLACGTDFYQRSYVLCQIQMSVATKQCAAE